MRRLIAAILALSALSVGAAPRVITWTQPTTYDDGSALPAADITGANVYLVGTGAAPNTPGGGTGNRWYSVIGSVPQAVIDITVPTWVQVAVIANSSEGPRTTAVLIAPKLKGPGAPANVGPVNTPPTVCSVPAGCPGP